MADAPRSVPAGARRHRSEPVLVFAALALAAYVLVFPFTQARYPPLTDLPFHAAQASIFRHYFDPAFHFEEQFTIHPLEAPYVSMYVVGALSALVTPITAATKVMAVVMLALVPAGLAVLLRGMKKDPLWAVLGLGLAWCTLTQWGFLSYMGATGLVAMSAGLALMVVDEPTTLRKFWLGASLVALFFTHVYCFPFAIAAIVLAAWLVFPLTGRFSVLARPLAPGLLLFALWLAIRPSALSPAFTDLGFRPERFGYILEHLFGSYRPQEGFPPTSEGNAERAIALCSFTFAALAAVTALVLRARERPPPPNERDRDWARRVRAFVLIYAAGLFVLYLVLPLEVGQWFFVYPREIVGVALFLLAAVPEMPRHVPARGAVLVLMACAVLPMARFVSTRFREFDAVTTDFRNVVQAMPPAPRLLYLIYDLRGSQKRASPFLHLPAWIQAEKGGALAFHFARWGFYPVRYREASPNVPPPFEDRFEWTPQHFDVRKQGPWFDTFLVRHFIEPHELFDADPTIHRVAHVGTWWIYRRTR
ncbi:MAG TPA: hypothetical protein VHC69_27590 [Polyangiaceae bacterium]|nr:hypothetical protein [Polyangiaceae bacterium]